MKEETRVFHIIVRPYEEGYMAMCRETGLIRYGQTQEIAHKKLFSATKTLLKAVENDPRLEDSLSVGLPFKYKLLFDYTVFLFVLQFFTNRAMNNLRVANTPISEFNAAFC